MTVKIFYDRKKNKKYYFIIMSKENYKIKYLKYKTKYLKLKNKINNNNNNINNNNYVNIYGNIVSTCIETQTGCMW
jgi:hypothetical protein